jgi:hypothetical protein
LVVDVSKYLDGIYWIDFDGKKMVLKSANVTVRFVMFFFVLANSCSSLMVLVKAYWMLKYQF